MNRHHLDTSAADTTDASQQAQWLSAAIDGELSAQEVQIFQQLCADASTETAVLRQWHSYTAIGEALRETNARCTVCDSADFMLQVRQRLQAEEPHHCSVQWLERLTGCHAGTEAAANEARFWKRAAGFFSFAAVVACGALLWLSHMAAPPAALTAGASVGGAVEVTAQTTAVTDTAAGKSASDAAVVAGQWEADYRWQEYLRTHRQYAGDPYWSDRRGAAVQRTGYQNNR